MRKAYQKPLLVVDVPDRADILTLSQADYDDEHRDELLW